MSRGPTEPSRPSRRSSVGEHPANALLELGPFTSWFPSGHAAADLAFVFGAAQELPAAFVPLSCASLAVHWALIRKRAHYPSDVLVGGALGIAVALASRRIWPPMRNPPLDQADPLPAEGSAEEQVEVLG